VPDDRRLAHLRGGVTHEDRVAILRELDDLDPLRLALRREIAIVNAAIEYVRTNTGNIDDIGANDEAWDQLQSAVNVLTQYEAESDAAAALGEAVTPDG
jgi:hypothetical protein